MLIAAYASIFCQVLEDLTQVIARIVQAAHHGTSWTLQNITYLIVRQALDLS